MPSFSFSSSEYLLCRASVCSSAVDRADGTGFGREKVGRAGFDEGRADGRESDGRGTGGTGFDDLAAEIREAGFFPSRESSPNWDETRAERLSLGVELLFALIVMLESERTDDDGSSLVISPTRRAS